MLLSDRATQQRPAFVIAHGGRKLTPDRSSLAA